ncbi:hypothetical protein, partial [Salmonella sp. S146_54837]|uniref:hypothetical protein n=1 Tax=Salmonella sp. S146_54837 TaxID=2665635 RepID=UPI001CAA3831
MKKPDGNLVKVVTIGEEPAPLNPEPIYAPPTPRRGGRACRCFFMSLILIFFLLVTFLCIGYFLRLTHYRGPTCGVGYYDDWDYFYDD